MITYEYIKNRYSDSLKKTLISEELTKNNFQIVKDYVYAGESLFNTTHSQNKSLLEEQSILSSGYDRQSITEGLLTNILKIEDLKEVKEYIFKNNNIQLLFQTEEKDVIKSIFSYVFRSLVDFDSKCYLDNYLDYVFSLNVFKNVGSNEINGESFFKHAVNAKYDSKPLPLISYIYNKGLEKEVLHKLYRKGILPLLDKKMAKDFQDGGGFNSAISTLIQRGNMKELKFFISHYDDADVKSFFEVKFNNFYTLRTLLPSDVSVYFDLKEMGIINLNNYEDFKKTSILISTFIDNKKNKELDDILLYFFNFIQTSSLDLKKKVVEDIFYKDSLNDHYFDAVVYLKDANNFKKLLELNDEVGRQDMLLTQKYWTKISHSRRKVTLAEYLVLNDAHELFYVLNEHAPINIKKLKKIMENNDISEKTFTAFESIMLKLDSRNITQDNVKIKRKL